MTVNTGRTVSKFCDFRIDDSGSTLRSIPINSINGVGLTFAEVNLTAFQDAVQGKLFETPDCVITIAGPFDTTAVQAVGTLSGSHTVLSGIVGLLVPLTLDVHVGIRQTYVEGEPQFGITATAANGFLCSDYQVNINDGTYTATFVMFPGSAAPAWGVASET